MTIRARNKKVVLERNRDRKKRGNAERERVRKITFKAKQGSSVIQPVPGGKRNQ